MAVQTINYANIPPQGAEGITSGFNAVYGPIAAKRKAEADALAAKMLQLQLLYEPQKYATEKAYKEAQTQELLQNIDLYAAIMQQAGLTPGATTETTNAAGRENNQNNPNLFANSGLFNELLRKKIGLDSESPQQAQQRAIETNRANADYSKELTLTSPTTDTLNRSQRLKQSAIPLVESYIELANEARKNPVTSRAGTGLFGKARIEAAEPTQILKNFAKGAEGYEEAKSLLTRTFAETDDEYQSRLYKIIKPLVPQIEEAYHISGEEVPQEFYDKLDELKPKSKKYKENPNKNSPIPEGKPAFVEMVKDGRRFAIPYNDVTEAFQLGYEISPNKGGR